VHLAAIVSHPTQRAALVAAVVAEHDSCGGWISDLGDVAVDHSADATAGDTAALVAGGP